MSGTTAVLIALIALCGSYIQSVTGFGFGIFVMMFFPVLLQYTEANVLSSLLGIFTSLAMVIQMRRLINWKNILFPLLGCLLATYGAVNFIKRQENELLLMLLGAVLLLLSVYFFFFSGKLRLRPSWYAGLTAGVLSGVMGGMFSMGGPPVVIYFLQSEEDSDHYLATISGYFVCSNLISITTKGMAGFVTSQVLLAFAVGAIGMAAGAFVGKKTRERVPARMVRKLVYGFMALSGAVYMITALM